MVTDKGKTTTRRANAIQQKLLDAAMAADQLLHRLVGERPMTDEERAVCDSLVQAIGEALAVKESQAR